MAKEPSALKDPLYYLDATALAALIRKKEVSPREVVQVHLDRIAAVDTGLHAIVTTLSEQALKAAQVAEAALMRGDPLGPLHGVPFTIKDCLDTAGVLTQRGSRLFAGHVPSRDATAVARMKAAGAIALAKTNLPEFSAWYETDNLVTGRANNPWNRERTAGGSSGGEAAAIAAGMSPIGLGSDVAISVRGPASHTGIAALKPTHGRIPYTGHWPESLSRYWVVGPMARSVRDLSMALSLLSGPDGVDGYAIHAPDARAADAPQPGRPVRVGWMTEPEFGPVDPDVTNAVAAAANALGSLGCEVEPVHMAALAERNWYEETFTILLAEIVRYLKPIVRGREAELHPWAASILAMAAPSFDDYLRALADVERLKSVFAGYFQRYDVLLCPVTPLPAPRPGVAEYVVHGQRVPATHIMRATSPFNMTGLPGLSVPYRFSEDGMPIGVQLVGRWLDEATLLRLGALLELDSTVARRRPIP
ncbi:MAG: glutamyl-tRNA(Gln) amidotransferase subunit [bacterium]|nr:glutamyl-tRNA(Gln) amidotransferase subunit [bacterium]